MHTHSINKHTQSIFACKILPLFLHKTVSRFFTIKRSVVHLSHITSIITYTIFSKVFSVLTSCKHCDQPPFSTERVYLSPTWSEDKHQPLKNNAWRSYCYTILLIICPITSEIVSFFPESFLKFSLSQILPSVTMITRLFPFNSLSGPLSRSFPFKFTLLYPCFLLYILVTFTFVSLLLCYNTRLPIKEWIVPLHLRCVNIFSPYSLIYDIEEPLQKATLVGTSSLLS